MIADYRSGNGELNPKKWKPTPMTAKSIGEKLFIISGLHRLTEKPCWRPVYLEVFDRGRWKLHVHPKPPRRWDAAAAFYTGHTRKQHNEVGRILLKDLAIRVRDTEEAA